MSLLLNLSLGSFEDNPHQNQMKIKFFHIIWNWIFNNDPLPHSKFYKKMLKVTFLHFSWGIIWEKNYQNSEKNKILPYYEKLNFAASPTTFTPFCSITVKDRKVRTYYWKISFRGIKRTNTHQNRMKNKNFSGLK